MSRRTRSQKSVNTTRQKKPTDSEFQSYTYIKNELKELLWNVSNPNRDARGQLYTQQECLQNNEISLQWGKQHPEYVVKLAEDKFWVIEAKPKTDDIDLAFKEATKDYGQELNKHAFVRAMVATGVAGNDIDRYLVKSAFWVEEKKQFVPIQFEGREITSLLTPEICRRLIHENTPYLKEFDIPDGRLRKAADDINDTFHAASIKKDIRASVVAMMLLSLLGPTEPNYNDTPDVFVNDINSRGYETLKRNGKQDFYKHIEIHLPEKEDAKLKFKEALVEAFFMLRKINIKAAMRTGSDVLGRFYETFLKYGNGAKDLGIVLTPRHITEFAAHVLNVTHNDLIYDPTCGTAGFLVSAFYRVRANSNPDQLETFRLHQIFGIDQQPTVTALAIVNMIFRGDGKNNIVNDNCLARGIIGQTKNGQKTAAFISREEAADEKKFKRVVTKVLMNPPFAQEGKKKAQSHEREYHFVNHALEQMEDNGLLFSILPCSTMVKSGGYKKWRQDLLKENTLLAAITFVPDLFYPQSQPPSLCIIVKKGARHPQEQNVLWIKIRSDGHRTIKSKRLPDFSVPNDLEEVRTLVQTFIFNPIVTVENVPKVQKAAKVDLSDPELELIPEAYLDDYPPTPDDIQQGVEETIRDTVAYLIRRGREGELLT
ncbi:SAM-dependent methyltransferase [Candidatus Bathyarchaeota archaeon]|nr:SAM-dependent methyltransferase [Candidatus Bathyarchaeota archaeon]